MSFRIADVQALLLASLIFGLFPAAKAQSTGGGQHIIFSSPNGQITSNAPLPMAQAPQPQETPNLPAGGVAISPFSGPPPAPIESLPLPALQQDDTRDQDDSQDPMNFRKQMGILTPAQIMKVPSPEQIFGLAEKPAESQKTLVQSQNTAFQNAATNGFASDTTTIIAEPGWAKAWLGETEKSDQSSNTTNTTEKTSGLFGGFFDAARSDNTFGNHSSGAADSLFGTPQTGAQQSQSPWSSQLIGSESTPAAPAESVANNFTGPGPASSPFTSQSPFTPPQESSLDVLPKLPALPSARPQNDQFLQPSAAPSWAPKPPPWSQPQTPLGTPVPANQSR